jgi:two-component system sensor histidine kinase AgrC
MKNIIRKLINTKVENNIKILIFSILIFICIGMFFYTFANEYRIGHNFILYLVAMIVLVSVLFSLIKQTIENNKLTKEYDKLLEFMITYEKEIEKQRTLRHETKNEFLAIKGKIHDKQKNKEIIAYIDEILKDKIEVKQEEYAKFGFLPANGIKGLCYLKTQEAQDKGIKTSINISKRVENSNIYKLNIKEQRDLGKILGVFLDNAIEASLTSNDKKFSIEVYLNLEKECQIIISNSFEEEINLDKMGNERFSTKGKTRGHGLLLVKHIIANNSKFSTNTKITGNLYTQTVTIKNSNSN